MSEVIGDDIHAYEIRFAGDLDGHFDCPETLMPHKFLSVLEIAVRRPLELYFREICQ